MKKWNVYAAAVLAAVGILGGCGAKNAESQAPAETQAAEQSAQESSVEESRETSAEESKKETEKNGTLSVTYVKSPLNVPSIVEQDQEIFASVFGPMGYDVQYSDLTTGPEQTQALASGDIQFLNAVGATSVILSASNDADIKIMSIYSRSPKAFKLFAKDDSIKTAEDLKGKKVAIFGLGDQKNYPDNFVDGMGILADAFQKAGAELVGFTSTDGYTFNQSRAVRGEKFCGLVIDQENQAQLTSKRIADWCKLIKEDFTSNKKE